jgi:hypothetical protein
MEKRSETVNLTKGLKGLGSLEIVRAVSPEGQSQQVRDQESVAEFLMPSIFGCGDDTVGSCFCRPNFFLSATRDAKEPGRFGLVVFSPRHEIVKNVSIHAREFYWRRSL